MQNMIQVYDEQGQPIKGPEEKEYLLLLNYEEDSDKSLEKTFEFMNGREQVYFFLKEELMNNGLDPFNSFVIVETVKLADRLTVVGFMEVCKKHFPDDDFSILDLGYNEDAIAMYLANDGVLNAEESTTGYVDDADVLAMDLIGKEEPIYDDDVEDV